MTQKLQTLEREQTRRTRRRCQGCGSYVTERFTRVFGDNEDDVYACLECSTMRELRAGSGVTPGG
jgi:hypothetical protein